MQPRELEWCSWVTVPPSSLETADAHSLFSAFCRGRRVARVQSRGEGADALSVLVTGHDVKGVRSKLAGVSRLPWICCRRRRIRPCAEWGMNREMERDWKLTAAVTGSHRTTFSILPAPDLLKSRRGITTPCGMTVKTIGSSGFSPLSIRMAKCPNDNKE